MMLDKNSIIKFQNMPVYFYINECRYMPAYPTSRF